MFNKRTAIKYVTEFAHEIKQSGIDLNKVILFGSYAGNKQHEWSDTDVAIVADEFTGIGYHDIGLFSSIAIRHPYYFIQPRTFNSKDFAPFKDPFVSEILSNGIVIKI